jgi:hypothetical protein
MIEMINLLLAVLIALILVHYVRKYYHLTSWLKQHAEMTWETYKRLGK